jgi:hypothetical protein
MPPLALVGSFIITILATLNRNLGENHDARHRNMPSMVLDRRAAHLQTDAARMEDYVRILEAKPAFIKRRAPRPRLTKPRLHFVPPSMPLSVNRLAARRITVVAAKAVDGEMPVTMRFNSTVVRRPTDNLIADCPELAGDDVHCSEPPWINRGALMREAHRIAREVRKLFDSYRVALAYGMGAAWAQVKVARDQTVLRSGVCRTYSPREWTRSRRATRRCGGSVMRVEKPHDRLHRRIIRGTVQLMMPGAYTWFMRLYWAFHSFGRVRDALDWLADL